MSEDTAAPGSGERGASESPKPRRPHADIPVGDLSVEGETEVGPHPELTNLENVKQADLPAAAEHAAEGTPHQE